MDNNCVCCNKKCNQPDRGLIVPTHEGTSNLSPNDLTDYWFEQRYQDAYYTMYGELSEQGEQNNYAG